MQTWGRRPEWQPASQSVRQSVSQPVREEHSSSAWNKTSSLSSLRRGQAKFGSKAGEDQDAGRRFTVTVRSGGISRTTGWASGLKVHTLHRKHSGNFPLKTTTDRRATRRTQPSLPCTLSHTLTQKVIKQQKVSPWVWDIKSKKETKGWNDFLLSLQRTSPPPAELAAAIQLASESLLKFQLFGYMLQNLRGLIDVQIFIFHLAIIFHLLDSSGTAKHAQLSQNNIFNSVFLRPCAKMLAFSILLRLEPGPHGRNAFWAHETMLLQYLE